MLARKQGGLAVKTPLLIYLLGGYLLFLFQQLLWSSAPLLIYPHLIGYQTDLPNQIKHLLGTVGYTPTRLEGNSFLQLG